MTTEEILARLEGVRKSGNGWTARCPAHDDEHSSLSVARGRSGDPVLKCHAGCSTESVVAALGLVMSDLFTNGKERTAQSEIVATYDYTDENGQLLSQVCRLFPKGFRQRRPDGRGGWTWKLGTTRRVLYRLPAVIEAVALGKLIYVVEGEKDVHAIEAADGVATCNPSGALKWRSEYSEVFRGARVQVVADRDEAGRQHARDVVKALTGIASSVDVVEARGGKDASDHLATGHALDDFLPAHTSKEEDGPEPLYDPAAIRFSRYANSEPPERRSIVRDLLPLGIVGEVAGMGGTAKSVLFYQLAISTTTGAPWLGLPMEHVGGVLYIAAEDDDAELHRRGRRLLQHYETLGHHLDRTALGERLHVVSRTGEDSLLTRVGPESEMSRTPLVGRLIATARRITDLRLILLDPSSRWRGGRANDEDHSTRFVEVLEHIRDETGATVLVSLHANKASIRDPGEADQSMVRGSSALVDGARWVLAMQRLRRDAARNYGLAHEEAPYYVCLDLVKSNYTAPWPGLWVRRASGGVLVPCALTESRTTAQARRAESDYLDILARIQELLRAEGPMSKRALRDYCGRAGVLAAGDQTVRVVVQRALREGSVTLTDGLLHVPPEVAA